jgi:hypothetical protein
MLANIGQYAKTHPGLAAAAAGLGGMFFEREVMGHMGHHHRSTSFRTYLIKAAVPHIPNANEPICSSFNED